MGYASTDRVHAMALNFRATAGTPEFDSASPPIPATHMKEPLHPGRRAVEVLLVEDNPGDVRLTQEAFKDGRLLVNINVAADGIEAMDFLNRRGKFENAPRPELILLDLNLPRKNGREVLTEIKADPELKRVPVIIMTTSKAEQDIHRAYNLNANCYIAKPVELDEFLKVVRSIEDFWLSIVTLPRE